MILSWAKMLLLWLAPTLEFSFSTQAETMGDVQDHLSVKYVCFSSLVIVAKTLHASIIPTNHKTQSTRYEINFINLLTSLCPLINSIKFPMNARLPQRFKLSPRRIPLCQVLWFQITHETTLCVTDELLSRVWVFLVFVTCIIVKSPRHRILLIRELSY